MIFFLQKTTERAIQRVNNYNNIIAGLYSSKKP